MERLMDRLMELYNMDKPPMFETLAKGKHSGFEFFIVWCASHPDAYIRIPLNTTHIIRKTTER